ncbi:tail fiber domain-containing protein, partial [Xanthovirga aplysinae]|uniref:tail fiber domain-containing protein n=1 Tax=Xanthovirga aplysinae TaxID=2529853 RepID=UPI0016571C7F
GERNFVIHQSGATRNYLHIAPSKEKGSNTADWGKGIKIHSTGYLETLSNLRVNGSTQLEGSLTTQEFLFSQGTFQESDIRSKEDICGLHQVLDKVMLMNPIQYRYKADKKRKLKHLGFGAQEVKELFPELVYYSEEKDLYSLNYGNLGAINTAAIQEINVCLHQGLSQQKNAIEEQKAVGIQQKRTLRRLENQVKSQKRIIQNQKERIEAQQETNAWLKENLQLQEIKIRQQAEEMQEVKNLLAELSAPTLEKMGKKWRSLFGQ